VIPSLPLRDEGAAPGKMSKAAGIPLATWSRSQPAKSRLNRYYSSCVPFLNPTVASPGQVICIVKATLEVTFSSSNGKSS
jgi:hypothetical protein